MKSKTLELEIEKIRFEYDKVSWRTVKGYMEKFQGDDIIKRVNVTHCTHNDQNYLSDGHHKSVAAYLAGKKYITAEVEECPELCKGGGSYSPYFHIHDILILKWFGLQQTPVGKYIRKIKR